MEASPLVWALTIGAIVGLLLFDFFVHVRVAHVHDERVRPTG